MHPHGVGTAQAGAQIVRVGDAVEDEQQGRLRRRIQDIIESDVRQRIVDDRDDTLVTAVTRESVEARVIDEVEGDARRFRAGDEVAHARIVAARLNVERVHGLGPLAKARRDGVESEERSSGGHGLC